MVAVISEFSLRRHTFHSIHSFLINLFNLFISLIFDILVASYAKGRHQIHFSSFLFVSVCVCDLQYVTYGGFEKNCDFGSDNLVPTIYCYRLKRSDFISFSFSSSSYSKERDLLIVFEKKLFRVVISNYDLLELISLNEE